ncbi:hypothetical protein HTG_07640 [Natrinema mahii]|nr:hypothetical protein HTG_07640 [Natrinema mahii]
MAELALESDRWVSPFVPTIESDGGPNPAVDSSCQWLLSNTVLTD